MVQIRRNYPVNTDGSVSFDAWLAMLESHTRLGSGEDLRRAFELSWELEKQVLSTLGSWTPGVSSFHTGLEMSEILAQLGLDTETLIASILYRPVRESRLSLKRLKQEFGAGVATLVEGVLRMAAISSSNISPDRVLGQNRAQVENVRKMLLAMVDDVRVALIKLAERTCAIRAVKYADQERQQRVAREIFDVYAPLAHRLGIGQLKWELEDLSFRYLQADSYKRIASLLDERRIDREKFIDSVTAELRRQLERVNIDAEVNGRPKSIYSIWRKMQRKKLDFSQIFDIRAVRILVPEIRDCYATLGIVHNLWRVIPNEFDDYIATPKENGYQSLHTAVIGHDNKIFEVQIRTYSMDEDAELGVCAHWRYKEGLIEAGHKDSYDEKIAWLRQVLAWHDEMGMAGGLVEQLRVDFAHQDRIYVFTPEGHVVDMMSGATPLDFAYYVHTDLGNSCRGAKVNGKLVPLNYRLQTGDRVEVLTSARHSPRREWLNPAQAYVNTPRAKAKLIQWFRAQSPDDNCRYGKSMLQSEFARLGLHAINYQLIARKLGCKNTESLFASVGVGSILAEEVIAAAQELSLLVCELDASPDKLIPHKKQGTGQAVRAAARFTVQFAICCKPSTGDSIIGYLVNKQKLMVHRTDCRKLLDYQNDLENKGNTLIEVNWSEGVRLTFPAEIYITAWDRAGLLRDITTVLADEKIEVMRVNTHSDRSHATAEMRLHVEVESFPLLLKVLDRINRLNNVIEARRIEPDAGIKQ
ncbi:MAG: bifunctional (p)ppGpp synthetase/guanosine-3',5'-bis(diphosphate) 3'-pyrophosphohydrolase [Pseudomonadales bacterium]|nr:bifunctional (p)ppGpp synthetase/guanosine-3',5'-bis(diphosphate) 3'-pyrophosphohydrolase [Pseudomonadales bacterium]